MRASLKRMRDKVAQVLRALPELGLDERIDNLPAKLDELKTEYQSLEQIGRGKDGIVFRASDSESNEWIVKVLSRYALHYLPVTSRVCELAMDCSALAVRCWPEFFTELGCAACGAMSMLSNESIPCSCEADVNGTVTQLILQWLSGKPAFGTDFVSADEAADQGVFWHCGLAPLDMADPEFPARGTLHSNRRLPLLMEFPLKPGTVTVSRLSQASGEYQLLVGNAEMLSAPPSFSGTSGVVRFERPIGEVLDTILSEGLEHHVSLTYGNHVDSLLALARRLDLPLIRI